MIGGRQILLCPECQESDQDWIQRLDHCPQCGSTRLSVVMGSGVCRECGFDWPLEDLERL